MMRILFFLSVLMLVSCASNPNVKHKDGFGSEVAPSTYKVRSGDTLFSICWRYGLDLREVMQKNNITDPHKIEVSQKLYLASSASHSKSSDENDSHTYNKPVKRLGAWVWPLQGRIIKRFSAGRIGANGLRISGKPKQTVNAAESGIVAYKGNGLKGYGNVVIIKHKNGLLSAYGFLSKTYVKKGQKVSRRQKIGTVGYGPKNQLMLHFEVRTNGRPTNPMSYIGSQYYF